MIKILKERERKERVRHVIEFDLIEDPNSGFCFDADEDGNVMFNPEYREIQQANYNMCLNSDKYDGPHRRTYSWSYSEPAEAECICGEHIELTDQYMGACGCPKCGRWYNLFGQELNPPHSWSNSQEGDDI